jgi:hypothetical protein
MLTRIGIASRLRSRKKIVRQISRSHRRKQKRFNYHKTNIAIRNTHNTFRAVSSLISPHISQPPNTHH